MFKTVYKKRPDGRYNLDLSNIRKKNRIVPRPHARIPGKKLGPTAIDSLPPWDVTIPGFDDIMIIRHVDDVIEFKRNPKKLTELMWMTGIINPKPKCDHDGCQGTLRIHFNPKACDQWNRHGGYYYKCPKCPTNKNRRSITYGSIFHEKSGRGRHLSFSKLLMMIYAYAVVSHQVIICPSKNCFYKIIFNFDVVLMHCDVNNSQNHVIKYGDNIDLIQRRYQSGIVFSEGVWCTF